MSSTRKALAGLTVLVTLAVVLLRAQTTYVPTMPLATTPALGQGSNVTITGNWPNNTIAANQAAVMTGTTASIGGSLLLLGACATGTATVTGATNSMVAVTSPQNALPNGIQFQAYVSSANTVTVQECAIASLTPSATPFNVRVIP